MTGTPHLVQLVPDAAGGIRDYAESIQRVWSRSGVDCRILALAKRDVVAAPLWTYLEQVTPQASDMRPRDQTVLIVHFSGYGYEPRGLCGWLNTALAAARAHLGPRLRIVVMFHELFASGPPWRSAFWLGGHQARIAAKLAALSDVNLTNTQGHAHWLEQQLGPQRRVAVWPVFSNVGELEALPAFAMRRRRLVVFGAESTRKRALQELQRHTPQLGQLGIDEVIEVGAGQAIGARAGALPAHFAGRLDQVALSELLSQSAFGLIEYPTQYMGKSTVFAAYAAHGCVALNAHSSNPSADGLTPGRHFLELDPRRRGVPSDGHLHHMALDAKAWYDRHTLPLLSAALARACGVNPNATDAPHRQD